MHTYTKIAIPPEELEKIIRKVVREETASKEDLKSTEERLLKILTKKIEDSQENTINVLSKLIHTGYTILDERVTKIEEEVQNTQQKKN